MFTVRKLTATLLLSIGIVTPIMLLAFLSGCTVITTPIYGLSTDISL